MGEEEELQELKEQIKLRMNFVFEEMKQTRKQKGLSILHVSNTTGIGYGYVSDIENGKHHKIGLHTIMRYCEGIDEDYNELLMRAERKFKNYQHNK